MPCLPVDRSDCAVELAIPNNNAVIPALVAGVLCLDARGSPKHSRHLNVPPVQL